MNIDSGEIKTSFSQNTKSTFSSRFRNRLRKKKSVEESNDTGDVSLEDVHKTPEVSKEMSATKRKKQYERFNRLEEFFYTWSQVALAFLVLNSIVVTKIAIFKMSTVQVIIPSCLLIISIMKPGQGFTRACKIFRYSALEF